MRLFKKQDKHASASSPSAAQKNASASSSAQQSSTNFFSTMHSANANYFSALDISDASMNGNDQMLHTLSSLGMEYVHSAVLQQIATQNVLLEGRTQLPQKQALAAAAVTPVDQGQTNVSSESENGAGQGAEDSFGDLEADESADGDFRLVITRQAFIRLQMIPKQQTNTVNSNVLADSDESSEEAPKKRSVERLLEEQRAAFAVMTQRTKWKPRWLLMLHQVQSFEADIENPLLFYVYFYPRSSIQVEEASLNRMVIQCQAKFQREEWVVLCSRVLHEYWQRLFESTIVQAPEAYWTHSFVRKINRHGQEQVRCIIVSDTSIYNAKYMPGGGDPRKCVVRWILPISTISRVHTFTKSPSYLEILFDKKKATAAIKNQKNAKVHEHFVFAMRDKDEVNMMIAILARGYSKETNGAKLERRENAGDAGKSKD